MELTETKAWVLLNDETLEILVKAKEENNPFKIHTEPMIFRTEKEANDFAAHKLDSWTVVKIHFKHKFINHKPNMDKYKKEFELNY